MTFIITNKSGYLPLLCAVFCCCLAQDKLLVLLTPEQTQHLWQQGEMCVKQAGYPVSAMKEIFKWPISGTGDYKQIYHCTLHKAGYLLKDGHLILEKYLSLNCFNCTLEEVVTILRECNKITLEDPKETAYQVSECTHKSCIFAFKNEETGGIDNIIQF